MKQTTRISMVLFFICMSMLQLNAQRMDKKNGRVQIKDDEGHVLAEGRVKNHYKTGPWKFYDDEGHLDKLMSYEEGQLTGPYVGYLSDGTVYIRGNYQDGKKDGEWIKYYSNGKKASLETYSAGKIDGLQQWYYSDGKLKEQSNYKEGVLLYDWTFYPNGHVRSVKQYNSLGREDGRWVTYPDPAVSHDTLPSTLDEYAAGSLNGKHEVYVKGHLTEQAFYQYGKLIKTKSVWNENGEPVSVESYDNSIKNGECLYYSHGKVYLKENYRYGNLDGYREERDSTTERLIMKAWYSRGNIDSSYTYWSTGKLKEVIKKESGGGYYSYYVSTSVERFDSLGRKTEAGSLKNKVKHGTWTTYFSNGKKETEIEYDNGEAEGSLKLWYSNGKLKLSTECTSGSVYEQPKAFDKSGVALKKNTKPYNDVIASIPEEIENDPENYRPDEATTSNRNIEYVEPDVVEEVYDVPPPEQVITQEGDYGYDEDVLVSDEVDPNVREKSTNNMQNEEIFTYAEEMPKFPGGESQFAEYLRKNIKYPKGKEDISGTVYVRFVVEKDGSISNATVLKNTTYKDEFSSEALRVINAMPKWTPAKMNGRSIRCYVTQPVKFTSR